MYYYDTINSYDTGNAKITTFELAIVPSHFGGYWTLMTILFVFLVTFTLSVKMFRDTQYSLPENAWHTIAQISESPELRDVLREAKVASDDEVEHFINGTKPPVGFGNNVRHVFETIKGLWNILSSIFRSRPEVFDTPRFVVRDGLFARTTGAEAEGKLEMSDLRCRSMDVNRSSETLRDDGEEPGIEGGRA